MTTHNEVKLEQAKERVIVVLAKVNYTTTQSLSKLSLEELLLEVAMCLEHVSDPYNHYSSCGCDHDNY